LLFNQIRDYFSDKLLFDAINLIYLNANIVHKSRMIFMHTQRQCQ